jgi:hypothetical protein
VGLDMRGTFKSMRMTCIVWVWTFKSSPSMIGILVKLAHYTLIHLLIFLILFSHICLESPTSLTMLNYKSRPWVQYYSQQNWKLFLRFSMFQLHTCMCLPLLFSFYMSLTSHSLLLKSQYIFMYWKRLVHQVQSLC